MSTLTDQQLLIEFSERRTESAFTELVQRHVELIYSAALRMVRDPHLAEDVTQNVFIALAQNAGKLTDRTVLSGWLHRTTQNIAANTVRSEVRRRIREQETAIMHEVSETSDASWDELSPHIDAALNQLSDSDRDAVLLRYFEKKSAQEMANVLGISTEAAQKRANRAVERLRELFVQRGIAVGAGGLAAAISSNAVQAVPAGLLFNLSTATLVGTAVSPTVIAAKAIAMTTFQKTIVVALIAVFSGAAVYEATQAAHLRDQVNRLQNHQTPTSSDIDQLQKNLADATSQIAALLAENAQLKETSAQKELLKLRGEVSELKSTENDPVTVAAKAWLAKVNKLKHRLEENPGAKIPEMQFLTEDDWISIAKDANLDIKGGVRMALSGLRHNATIKFLPQLESALGKYVYSTKGELPQDTSQLAPFFDNPVDSAMLARYQMLTNGNLKKLPDLTRVIDDVVVDKDFDCKHYIWSGGYRDDSTWHGDYLNSPEGLAPFQIPDYETPVP